MDPNYRSEFNPMRSYSVHKFISLHSEKNTTKSRGININIYPKDGHSGDKTFPKWPELDDRKQMGDGEEQNKPIPERLVLPKIREATSNAKQKEARSPVHFPLINAISKK
ncbi:hypothetical protein NDU88_003972, partial [Pleurodeles waltl]